MKHSSIQAFKHSKIKQNKSIVNLIILLFLNLFILSYSAKGQNLNYTVFVGDQIENYSYYDRADRCASHADQNIGVSVLWQEDVLYEVSTGAIRIRYDLINSNNQIIRTREVKPYEDIFHRYFHYQVTKDDINYWQNSNELAFKPIEYEQYRVKITIRKGSSVGTWNELNGIINNWDHVVAVLYTQPSMIQNRDAHPDFSVSSKIGFENGSIPIVCPGNITINAEQTNCETKYLLEVIEVDQWWGIRTGSSVAEKWFQGQAPYNIDLQQFTQTYGTPPFTMESRNVPPTIHPNYYLIKLSVFEDSWRSKQVLLKVDGTCKTKMAFETKNSNDIMIPMTDTEVEAFLSDHPLPSNFHKEIKTTSEPYLFPNPAETFVTIENFLDYDGVQEVISSDVYGNSINVNFTLDENDMVRLDVSTLRSGLHIVTVITTNGIQTHKLKIK